MAEKIAGKVKAIGPTGNLVTDIPVDRLADCPRSEQLVVWCDEHETFGLFEEERHGQEEMTLIAVLGKSGHLELAIVGDRADLMLGISPGAPVEVRW